MNELLPKKILIMCTGNSCRSQMAEAFLSSFNENLSVFSAGTSPSKGVHPLAIEVMKELKIDLSTYCPKHVKTFLGQSFDYVITVCSAAKKICPIFYGNVRQLLHIGFDDPDKVIGTNEFILAEFRRIRDEIREKFYTFYLEELVHKKSL